MSLYGVSFGVTKKEEAGYKYEMFELTASTSRTVSFKLDLDQKKVYAWVNKTVPAKTPFVVLSEGTWYPCLKLKGKGNPVIFNPFALDPENYLSPYNPFNTSVLSINYPAIKTTKAPSIK